MKYMNFNSLDKLIDPVNTVIYTIGHFHFWHNQKPDLSTDEIPIIIRCLKKYKIKGRCLDCYRLRVYVILGEYTGIMQYRGGAQGPRPRRTSAAFARTHGH